MKSHRHFIVRAGYCKEDEQGWERRRPRLRVHRASRRVFDLAASVCGDRVLVSGRDYGLPFVADPHPLAGPTAGILAGAAVLAGCTGKPSLQDKALTAQDFALERFFDGQTVARGQFQDVFGTVRRQFVVQITGDNPEGKRELDNFIDPEKTYPVIATTSKLMSTGVDAQTCKLIVLDKRIGSMTEFKQIIGRGTRINEDYGKYWFTIMDFKKATELFADPGFDGDPVQIYEPGEDDSPVPPDDLDDNPEGGVADAPEAGDPGVEVDPPFEDGGGTIPRVKYVIANQAVYVIAERVQYYGPDGKLITESLHDYTRQCVQKEFGSLKDFLRRWSDADQKKVIIDELATQGVLWEQLAEEVGKKLGKILDPFDLICHVAFDQPPLSRKERADQVKKRNYFTKYQGAARQVLEALLDKYADTGIEHIEDIKILQLDPFSQIGAPIELVKAFGGKAGYNKALHELEDELYAG